MMLSFFTISWIMAHLGKNPVSGGNPPNDSKVNIMALVSTGIVFQVFVKDSVVVFVFIINMRNNDSVSRI